jgi:Tfp pilus assembly protein PilV
MRKARFRSAAQVTAQTGVVLLEVLVAAVTLGIAIIGVSLMLSNSWIMVAARGDEYVALYLAQQKLEQCIAQGFTTTCETGSPETICYNCTTPVPVGMSATQRFTRVTTVTNPDASTKQISVTVTPSLGRATPVTLVTQIRNTS